MDPTQLRSLTFLMSFGGLMAACPGTGSDTDSDSGSDGNTTTTTATSDPTTSSTSGQLTDGTGSMSATDSGTATSTTGTSGEPTTGPVTGTTSSTTEPDTGTTGEPPPEIPACADFGDKFAECYPRYARYGSTYAMYCNTFIAEGAVDGPACSDALEELFACIAGVDCQAFGMELQDPVMCATQSQAVDANCPSFGP